MKGSTKLFLAIFILVFITWTVNTIEHWDHFALTWVDTSILDSGCNWILGYIAFILFYICFHAFALAHDYEEYDFRFKDYDFILSFGPFLIFPLIVKLADKYL